MNARRLLAGVALSTALAGCGGDDQLDEPENVRVWMTTASALAVYANVSTELEIADGHASFPDPACPVTSDDGALLTITGGCTDSRGTTYRGSATVEREGDEVTLTLMSYGSADDERDLVERRGTLTRKRVAEASHTFAAHLIVQGGMRTTIDYRGSVSGGYDARSVWSGHGRVSRDGVVAPTGTINATTENEVVDDSVCSGQPVSGKTTIETEDQNAVVFYDGDRDCDMAQRARYRVDGEERGFLSGITCSVGHARGHAGVEVLASALALAALLRRRRAPAS